MDVNMYLKHVMIDMVASGCKWLLVDAYTHTLGTRSAQSLHIAYCIKLYVGSYIYGCIMIVLSYG